MTVVTGNIKKPKSMLGLIALGCVVITGIFTAVFISTNNITVSFDAIFSKNKYPAKAFVNKRKGLLTASLRGQMPTSDLPNGTDISAKVSFDTSEKKVRLSLRDKNNKPVSRIMVIGTVSQVGQARNTREFKMSEYSKGDFRSGPLDLAEGGWVLMVSGYNLYTNNREKLMFHTERAIFLGKK